MNHEPHNEPEPMDAARGVFLGTTLAVVLLAVVGLISYTLNLVF